MYNLVKNVVSFMAGWGAMNIVENVAKAAAPTNVSKLGKACNTIGAFALAAIAGDAASNKIDKYFDKGRAAAIAAVKTLNEDENEAVAPNDIATDISEEDKVNECESNNDSSSENSEAGIQSC